MALLDRFKYSSTLNKIIIIIAIILILAALMYLGYLIYNYLNRPDVEINLNTNQPADVVYVPDEPQVIEFTQGISDEYIAKDNFEQQKEIIKREESVLVIAKAFIERFGSFSNVDDYSNFEDLQMFMSDKMKQYVQVYEEDLRTKYPVFGQYHGYQTKVISSEVTDLDEVNATAAVRFNTQRQEFTGSENTPNIYYQQAVLNLIKSGNSWLVNGVYWQ